MLTWTTKVIAKKLRLLAACFMFGLFSYPEDGSDIFL
jgi:hypothetical protein